MSKYTFEDFVASKRRVVDHLDDGTEETGKSGFIYGEAFWIRDNMDGTFYTMIERSEYTSSDLSLLERRLWEDFAKAELESI